MNGKRAKVIQLRADPRAELRRARRQALAWFALGVILACIIAAFAGVL